MKDIQLSRNFWLSEFTRSTTATKEGLCTGEAMCIEPTEEQVARLRDLCVHLLQPLRDRFGPLTVTSGLRSVALNGSLSGASDTSAHLSGDGADVAPARASPAAIMAWLEKNTTLRWDQAILYPSTGHIHFGHFHPTTRKQRQELRIQRNGKFVLWSSR